MRTENISDQSNLKRVFGAALMIAMATGAQATLVYDLDRRVDGGSWQLPQGTSVGTATFDNVYDADGNKTGFVDMTLKANQTAGGFIRSWYFTLSTDRPADSISVIGGSVQMLGSASFNQPLFTSTSKGSGLAQYQLNFGFDFGTDPNARFDTGDILKVRLGTGLTELDFANAGSQGIFTALHLQGLNGNPASVKIADTSGPEMWAPTALSVVPEAGTFLAGFGLIGLCLGAEFFRRKSEA